MNIKIIEEIKLVFDLSRNSDWINIVALVVSIFATIISIIAIFITIHIAKSQKRISLLEIRLRILDDIDRFINQILSDWNWDGSMYPYSQYTKEQVRIIFDDEFAELFEEIGNVATRCIILRGDEDCAKKNGNYNGKTDIEIEDERLEIEKYLSNNFKKQKDKAYNKWIKV